VVFEGAAVVFEVCFDWHSWCVSKHIAFGLAHFQCTAAAAAAPAAARVPAHGP
jgi:hypothetical protein